MAIKKTSTRKAAKARGKVVKKNTTAEAKRKGASTMSAKKIGRIAGRTAKKSIMGGSPKKKNTASKSTGGQYSRSRVVAKGRAKKRS